MFAQSADALALKLIRSLLRVETESDSQLPRIDSQTAIRIQLFRALGRNRVAYPGIAATIIAILRYWGDVMIRLICL